MVRSGKANARKRNLAQRPFPARILARARAIAAGYHLILHFEDGEWYGEGLELPNAWGDGKTPEACIRNTRKSLSYSVAQMLEDGQAPPAPASDEQRTQQVNVRLSVREKAILEQRARQMGFRGMGDYVRAAALPKG